MLWSRAVAVIAVATSAVALGAIALEPGTTSPAPSAEAQVCDLPPEWLETVRRGYHERRSGQVALLPRAPIYMSTGGKGWTHSGPWDHLQRVPLVFYGPGIIAARGDVDDDVTLADVAPTTADLVGIPLDADGRALEVAVADAPRPRLIVTVVWDGGGWNALDQWPDAWPNLARLMRDGVSFTRARVGSSPSVTPAVHTTLGTGVWPATHSVTDVPVRDDDGVVVDAFYENSARFITVPTLAEMWDERNDNEALIGMVGYEPWHLGMIGKGAEATGGDRDHAVWINRARNTWVTKRAYYALPRAFRDQDDLAGRLDGLDRLDGADERWLRVPLDVRSRIEETPAFVAHHEAILEDLIADEGYGADRVTDLLFTNFKQIDRLAHYFNMVAPEVEAVMRASDDALGSLVDHLDDTVGRGDYVVIVTADHGLQPDQTALDAYAIEPNEVERDLAIEFGPVVRSVWPTQAFLLGDELASRGIAVDDVARFLAEYTLADNATRVDHELFGAGGFGRGTRLFELAVPATTLQEAAC